MPRKNRVLPTGEITAIPLRGTFTGNRGILVDASGRMSNRRWTHKAWICCTLKWQGRRRPIMQPRTWTELFFHDEAVAMAAGHRPCAYCRRPAYKAFRTAWEVSLGPAPLAPEIDNILHGERLKDRAQRREAVDWADIPPASFVLIEDRAHLVLPDHLRAFDPARGYGRRIARPAKGFAIALTPRSLRAVLSGGYRPVLHPSLDLPD